MKSQLKSREKSDNLNRVKKKMVKIIKRENDIYSPYKIPEFKAFK